MGILDVFKHKDNGTATAVKNRAKTTGAPNRKYTQQINGAAHPPQRLLANADDPTDQLPRFHPTTEFGRTQQ